MLRFYRHIRKTLMEKQKMKSYVFYAIGEIFLVVIGILIALQVNNWNEYRKERNLETRYLQRLAADLEKDIESFSRSLDANESRKNRSEFLLEAIGSSELVNKEPTYFIESIEYAGYTYDPVISDHTFEEIKSSGRLAIIQNEELRTALSTYYSTLSNRDQYNFIRQEFQIDYLKFSRGILSPEQQIAVGSFSRSETYTQDEAQEAYRRMMAKPYFLEILPITIQSKTRTSEVLNNFKNEAVVLQEMIINQLNEL